MVVQTNIRVVFRELRGFTERVVQRIVLDATANLIEDTPVDTGWARANWIPSIGSPPTRPAGARLGRDARGRFTSIGDPDVGAARAAQQVGIATIATGYTLEQGNVSITNNVPYIRFLNEGSSSQAPPMFVQMAIARALQAANGLKSP